MKMAQPISESHREFVGSLAKGLSVIRVFGKDSPNMSISDVARSTGITRAGARRLLLTLHSLGYLQTDGRRYSLAAKTLELGYSFLSSRGWLSIASPLLESSQNCAHRKRLGYGVGGHRRCLRCAIPG